MAARLGVLVVVAALAACAERAHEREGRDALATLDARYEPLRAAFDADAAHVRLLAILSPT